MPTPFAIYCLAAAVLLMVGGFEISSIVFLVAGGLFEFAVFASAGVVSDYESPAQPTDEELGIDDGDR